MLHPPKTVCSYRLLPFSIPGREQSGANPPQTRINPDFFKTFRTLPQQRLFNEWYARDISWKVTEALRTRNENGAHYGAYAPLGYRKDPEQVGHLVIDDETKWIVEKIFALAVQDNGPSKIADQLIAAQIPTPSWFNFQRYGSFAHIYEGQPETKRYGWSITQVKSILQDENYIGNSVHNRQATLIEKILVHEATKDANGNKSREIEIIYRFVGKID